MQCCSTNALQQRQTCVILTVRWDTSKCYYCSSNPGLCNSDSWLLHFPARCHGFCNSTQRLQTTPCLSQQWQWICTCQPWASAERWGRRLRTLSCTTQDGCFPSSSSISRPMIHFTDTWVIIGVCSSPLGMKLHERSQGGGWGWVVVCGRSEDRVRSEWMKTKRQEWRAWRWSRRCNELNLTVVNGLVQEKPYFQWLNNEAHRSLLCEPHKQLTTNVKKKQKQWKYTAYDLLRRRVKRRLSKGLYGGAWIKMQDERKSV